MHVQFAIYPLWPKVYLLFICFQCLLDIEDLWGANGQRLDFTRRKGTEVTDCFNVPGSHKLAQTTRPVKEIIII